MKKSNKVIALSIFGIAASLLTMTGVSAATKNFDAKVPILQGWGYVSRAHKDQTTNEAYVTLSVLKHDCVTFYAKAVGESWGGGTMMTQTNVKRIVNYRQSYGTGTEVEAKYRNHTSNLNSAQIKGVFDYQ